MPADVDIINVHDLSCYSAMLFAKLLRPKAKLVWQINDLPYAYHVGPGKKYPTHWSDVFVRFSIRVIARLCDAITVNVRKNQSLVSELMGIEPLLFHPGVDQIFSTFSPRTLSAPLRLLSVGVFLPYRNYEVIIDAMDLLRSQGIETQLTLVGSTDRAQDYSDKIAAIAAEKKLDVRITGEIDEQRFKDVFASSHAFLFVNLEQSWGLAVFEAMNMSLPVILSDSVGAIELLGDCKGVRIVDATSAEKVAEAIADVHDDAKHYAAMASTAYEFSLSLGWDKLYCPDVLALFQRLLVAPRLSEQKV
jgi:glycosyltransferase involved in cell wall biosynthesis